MNLLDVAGKICKIILPIHEDVFYGNTKSNTAICTLSSMDMLKEIAASDIINRICVAGRLLSENKGIDALVRYASKNQNLDTLILCGREVPGHRAGHSLLCMHRYGVGSDGLIVNSLSPDPFLTVSRDEVDGFQRRIKIIDMIGVTDLRTIRSLL